MQAAEAQTGQAIPFNLWMLALIQLGTGVLIAPIVTSIFTFGEEFGWRGYLQPKLMPLGYHKALLLVGFIWRVWHCHESQFWLWLLGAPWTGFLMMTIFTVSMGIIFGWLAVRGQSIWPAVIAHEP